MDYESLDCVVSNVNIVLGALARVQAPTFTPACLHWWGANPI